MEPFAVSRSPTRTVDAITADGFNLPTCDLSNGLGISPDDSCLSWNRRSALKLAPSMGSIGLVALFERADVSMARKASHAATSVFSNLHNGSG